MHEVVGTRRRSSVLDSVMLLAIHLKGQRGNNYGYGHLQLVADGTGFTGSLTAFAPSLDVGLGLVRARVS
jgi:hypothetical protein